MTTDNNSDPACTANVTTRDEGGKVVARFVLPVAGSSTLKNASVKLGKRDAFPFSNENSQLLNGRVYNVIRTSKFSSSLGVMPLTVKALTAGTVKVVIDGTLSSGMKYSVNSGEKTLITTSTDIPVNAGDWVRFYGNGTETQAYGNYPSVKIQGAGEGKAPVPGGTWRFPSMDQWKALFAANGGDEFSCAGLNRIISNAGGTAMSGDSYWTSTDVSDKDDWAYDIQRDDDNDKVYYKAMPKGGIRDYARAVLVFYGRPE